MSCGTVAYTITCSISVLSSHRFLSHSPFLSLPPFSDALARSLSLSLPILSLAFSQSRQCQHLSLTRVALRFILPPTYSPSYAHLHHTSLVAFLASHVFLQRVRRPCPASLSLSSPSSLFVRASCLSHARSIDTSCACCSGGARRGRRSAVGTRTGGGEWPQRVPH